MRPQNRKTTQEIVLVKGYIFAVIQHYLFNLAVDQGCQTQLLESRSPAEFSSNPAPTHKPCSFQISLNDMISWIRCV